MDGWTSFFVPFQGNLQRRQKSQIELRIILSLNMSSDFVLIATILNFAIT